MLNLRLAIGVAARVGNHNTMMVPIKHLFDLNVFMPVNLLLIHFVYFLYLRVKNILLPNFVSFCQSDSFEVLFVLLEFELLLRRGRIVYLLFDLLLDLSLSW